MNRDATSISAVILMRKKKSLTQWTLSGNIRKDGYNAEIDKVLAELEALLPGGVSE